MSRNCRTCGGPLEWGWDEESQRWIPLEPIELHDDLPRRFQDENGVLRADHRQRHGGTQVSVTRLSKEISPLEAQAQETKTKKEAANARRRQRRAAAVG